MNTYGNDYGIKKLYITDFAVWQGWSENNINNIDEIVVDAINSAEGVYVYRSHAHQLEKNNLLKWLNNQEGLMCYRGVSLEFTKYNIIENFVPSNKECVYFLEFNKDSIEGFLKF